MKFKKPLLLFIAAALTIQLILGSIALWSISQLVDDTKWVEHTYKVIAQANQLKRFMIDQETGMRGHAVSGADEFLEPYRSGSVEFTALMSQLKDTVSDNPAQVKRLQQLNSLALQWQQNIAEPYIRLRQDILKGEHLERNIQQLIASGLGKQRMDALRQHVADAAISDEHKRRILLDMVNMETGLRGFLLSEDEFYLQPYQQASEVLDADLLAAAAPLALSNAAKAWKNQYAEKLIQLAKEEAKTADMEALYKEFEKKEGKRYMDNIRQQIALFISLEKQLLNQRLAKQTATAGRAKLIIIICVFLGFVMAALIMAGMGKNLLKTQQLQQQKLQSDTELKLLKAQVDAHFLFNTLNTIYYTANKDPELSRELLMDLSNLMRVNLKRPEELCSLSDELDHVQRYLRIEKVRFQDKLILEQHIEVDASKIKIPMYSVQTLVENAIKHGISQSMLGGTVSIHCYHKNDAIYIDISDTANLLDTSAPATTAEKGLGLNLVRERLKLYAKPGSELQLSSQQQLTVARLILT